MLRNISTKINSNSISITNNAWIKIKDVLKTDISCSFLFSASGGGCNGFNYDFKVIDKSIYNNILDDNKKFTPQIIVNDNYKVIVDPLSEMLLYGTTIDYIYEDYSKGIYESKFIFIPDKAIANTCGCGISFSLK